jgi:hypothetical protein
MKRIWQFGNYLLKDSTVINMNNQEEAHQSGMQEGGDFCGVECTKTCSQIRAHLRSIAASPDKEAARKDLRAYMLAASVSLTDTVCAGERPTSPGVSVLTAMLEQPDGHLVVLGLLDSLVEADSPEGVRIGLGSGLLYRSGARETKVLEDLLDLRARCAQLGDYGLGAVKQLLGHPAIEAFIRQKWIRVRFLFKAHIWYVSPDNPSNDHLCISPNRIWLLFTVSYSCYLRLEINTQIIRRDFYRFTTTPNTSNSTVDYFVKWEDCCINVGNDNQGSIDRAQDSPCFNFVMRKMQEHSIMNNEATINQMIMEDLRGRNKSELEDFLLKEDLKICHPNASHVGDWGHWGDSSWLVFLALLFMAGVKWLSVCVRLFLAYNEGRKGAKNWEKKKFQLVIELFVTSVAVANIAITVWSDIQHLKPRPARPFLDFDDGFRLIELTICCLAIYFLVEFVDEMSVLKLWRSRIIDPIGWFPLATSASALVSVLCKTQLTDGGMGPVVGLSAIGITLAWLSIILKIGRYSFTAFGNFATMFHILLKKLTSYLFYLGVLLFGFSFGFWVINQHEVNENETAFNNFSKSVTSSFVMFFGEFGEFGNTLDYQKEVEKKHYLTLAAFYFLFLMMIIMSSLAMLNLLLAAILTDYNRNMQEVHTANLVFMAQYSVVVHRAQRLSRALGLLWSEERAAMERLERGDTHGSFTYCARRLCLAPAGPPGHIHLEEEFQAILGRGQLG